MAQTMRKSAASEGSEDPQSETLGLGEPIVTMQEELASLRKDNQSLHSDVQSLKHQMAALSIEKGQEPVEGIDGITAGMFGPIYCPKCGLKLEGYSETGIRPQTYTHPFAPAPRLGNVQCELKGRQFFPPRIFLHFVKK